MTLETAVRVGPDGRLQVNLPPQFANCDVILTVRPADGGSINPVESERIEGISDPEERRRRWKDWVEQTAGSIDDPSFERPDQGWYEEREPLE